MASTTLCTVSLSPNGTTILWQGGNGSFDVTIADGCPWQAFPDDSSRITLGPIFRGTSSGTVSFTVAVNNDFQSKTLHVQVGPATYTITQDVEPCKPWFNPPSLNFANGGGIQATYVTLPDGCARNAQSNDSWIQIVSGGNGYGSGSVAASVPANMQGQRSGSVTIAGHSVAVTQDAGPRVTLTLATVGSGTLTASPSAAGGAYFVGTRVCLTATPGTGYALGSWSGTPLDSNHCLTMNANASVTATFVPAKVTLTLSVTPIRSGTVTATPAATGGTYAAGTKVCLTTRAASGYYFVSWSGATLDAQSCFTIVTNTSVRATFSRPVTLTLAVSPTSAGTVSAKPQPVRGTYIPGTKVCLTPAPKAGYAFSSWSGAKLDANNCLVMTANASVTAKFLRAYLMTLRVSPSGTGTVTALPASPNRYYAGGTKVCLTATPKSGYAFGSWSGATLDSGNCVIVNSTLTITASFVKTH